MTTFSRRFLGLLLALFLFYTYGLGTPLAATPNDVASTASPSTALADIDNTGVFKSDRGDFKFRAQSWAGNGAESDATCQAIIALMREFEDVTTAEQETALYSAGSQPFLQDKTRHLLQSPRGLYKDTPGFRPQGYIVRRLISTTDVDGTDLYFADLVTVRIDPGGNEFGITIPPSAMCTAELDVFRGNGKILKFDYPARTHPIYESLHFGEWQRFGLPTFKSQITWEASTMPTHLSPATLPTVPNNP
jgi:hypothetical protein